MSAKHEQDIRSSDSDNVKRNAVAANDSVRDKFRRA
jgi:hypothetical protein